MEDHDALYELIERYLQGNLTEDEKQAVEKRMAADTAFRREVALHEALQQQFGDTGENRLRTVLDKIMNTSQPDKNEPAPPKSQHPFWFRLVIAIIVITIAGIVLWYWRSTDNEKPAPGSATPVHEQPEKPAPELPSPAPVQPAPSQKPPEKNGQKQAIALADPADFVPNPDLEARIGGVRGDGRVEVLLTIPSPDAKFYITNDLIHLHIKGALNADSVSLRQSLRLFIYSNRPEAWKNKQPVFDLPLSFESTSEESYRIDFRRQLRLRPGLYYLVVGHQRLPGTGDGYITLWVSRFTAT